MSEEQWKWIPGYEGRYEVSDRGNVRTYFKHHTLMDKPQRELIQTPSRSGYKRVVLRSADGIRNTFFVHVLVLLTFVGDRPYGFQASHLNGISTDNSTDNLAWETPKQNINRKNQHGTMLIGERNVNSKITEQTVETIRDMLNEQIPGVVIAKELCVSTYAVSAINCGRAWGWLKHHGQPWKQVKRLGLGAGANNGRAKLVPSDISKIRDLIREKKLSYREIGALYGVHKNTIYGISSGTNWKKVTATP